MTNKDQDKGFGQSNGSKQETNPVEKVSFFNKRGGTVVFTSDQQEETDFLPTILPKQKFRSRHGIVSNFEKHCCQ